MHVHARCLFQHPSSPSSKYSGEKDLFVRLLPLSYTAHFPPQVKHCPIYFYIMTNARIHVTWKLTWINRLLKLNMEFIPYLGGIIGNLCLKIIPYWLMISMKHSLANLNQRWQSSGFPCDHILLTDIVRDTDPLLNAHGMQCKSL